MLLLPSVPGKTDRKETDTEHSFSLAMVAWYLAEHSPHLDTNACIRYALVHDLVELYSGDTFAYDKNDEAHATKASREQQAVEKLKLEWQDFPGMTDNIEGYEARQNAESKFVYALDKLMPRLKQSLKPTRRPARVNYCMPLLIAAVSHVIYLFNCPFLCKGGANCIS